MADPSHLSLSERLFALLRVLYAAMLVMTLFYVGVGEIARGHWTQDSSTFLMVVLVAAIVEAAAVVYIRFSLIPKVEQALQRDSEDKTALMNLRKWYVI